MGTQENFSSLKLPNKPILISRRSLLKSLSTIVFLHATGCASRPIDLRLKRTPIKIDRFLLIDPSIRLNLEVELNEIAIEKDFWCNLELYRTGKNPRMVFNFPSQHYVEPTINIDAWNNSNDVENFLKTFTIVASGPSSLVFQWPENLERLDLKIEEILDWSNFNYITKSLEDIAQTIQKEQSIDHIWSYLRGNNEGSTIELPTGIFLQPTDDSMHSAEWRTTGIKKLGVGGEIWSAMLENRYGRDMPLRMEILDVRGFDSEHVGSSSSKTIFAKDNLVFAKRHKKIKSPAIRAKHRLQFIASLSQRFPYDASDKTAFICYDPSDSPTQHCVPESSGDTDDCTGNKLGYCYTKDRAAEVYSYGLSSIGGTLDLQSKWDPEVGCSLQAWRHIVSSGFDQLVRIENLGYLYPLGVPAILVTLSERTPMRNATGHLVAPLAKQVFLTIPKPGHVKIDHLESPFMTIKVTTKKTPPLDPPSEGQDPGCWDNYHHFLPIVDGVPFEFEILGIDYAGIEHTSTMPLVFVLNSARDPKTGWISEPDFNEQICKDNIPRKEDPSYKCTPQIIKCESNTPFWTPGNITEPVKTDHWSGGIWDIDNQWLARPFRFVKFYGADLTVGQSASEGDTTLEIDWIEFVRGRRPDKTKPAKDGPVAEIPFRPRTRTMKGRIPSTTQFSKESIYFLVSYRDIRFKGSALLDPYPSAPKECYEFNLLDPNDIENSAEAFLSILPIGWPCKDSSSGLIDNGVAPRNPDKRKEMRNEDERINAIETHYYGTKGCLPGNELFRDLESEIRFGYEGTSEGLGGLAVPDTFAALLSRSKGPIGDGRESPSAPQGSTIQYCDRQIQNCRGVILTRKYDQLDPVERIDYGLYRRWRYVPDSSDPYEYLTRAEQCLCPTEFKETMVEFSANKMGVAGIMNGMKVADLFGFDAEIIPGIKMFDVFKDANLDFGNKTLGGVAGSALLENGKSSGPLKFSYKLSGIEELVATFGEGIGQVSLDYIPELFGDNNTVTEPGEPLQIGLSAGVDWSTDALNGFDLGIVKFKAERKESVAPVKSKFSIIAEIATSFSDGQTSFNASANLSDFTIEVLESISVPFHNIMFEMRPDGTKKVTPSIGAVELMGPLSFIKNLQETLGGLGDDYGIDIQLNPTRISISQDIFIPPASGTQQAGTFTIGPATIANLYFRWGIHIPIIGRNVLVFFFGLASREDPFTISILPWGGKAHALIEATTRGIRLLEISMEYGGMILVSYSIARGEASITAGILFRIEQVDCSEGQKTTAITLVAFTKITGRFDVAEIIQFTGMISISLGYASSGCKDGGEVISGEVLVKVSMKQGFIKISYSFAAYHEERTTGTTNIREGEPFQPFMPQNLAQTQSIDCVDKNSGNWFDAPQEQLAWENYFCQFAY